MKLLGFVCGAVLGIGMLAGALWRLNASPAELDAAAEPAPPPADHPVEPLSAAELAVPPLVSAIHPPAGEAAADESAADEPAMGGTTAPQPPAPAQPSTPASQTYTLWRPFSSRSAARGFARQIREQSGLAVDVRQRGEGAFEVVLPYRDEQELATMVRAIEDATRLEIR